MSILVVLLLISAITAASYAILRTQSTAVHIQDNSALSASARHAAITGLSYGVRAMNKDNWTGVGTDATRTLGALERFTVSFVAGDASLGPGNADYEDYAYRVTVQSTGYAEDPNDPDRVASHTVHAVMRLIPRALSASPSDWSKMESYTFYQTESGTTELEIPCQISGYLRLQDKLLVGDDYPDGSYVWNNYLDDLKEMYYDGYPDYRPINGRVYLPYYKQDLSHFYPLRYALGFTALNTSIDLVGSDWTKPANLTTYQIYPGGPVYDIPELEDEDQQNVNFEPDPLTNPLGLFYCDTPCNLKGNVSVRGTLFCKGDMKFEGPDIQFQSVDMPALAGTEEPVRLPVATAEKVLVKPGSATSIQGLVAAFNEFKVENRPTAVPFHLVGRLVAEKLIIKMRLDWDSVDWVGYYAAFQDYEDEGGDDDDDDGESYFPIWMGTQGYNPAPQITISPDETPVRYHWNNWANPIYVPHANDDDGLRWEMLQWKEGPG